MEETKMNRQLGTKWFTFYTKVRPWISCIATLSLLVDFLQYPDVYSSYWWLSLYALTGLAMPILAIIVFVKSSGDYGDFVRFVKGVLIFETVCIPFHQGVKTYVETFDLGLTLVLCIILLALAYFLWYRLNIKYFERRILVEEPEKGDDNLDSTPRPPQFSNPNEIPKMYGTYQVHGSDVSIQAEDKEEIVNEPPTPPLSPRFCTQCGNKLQEGNRFCNQCGTKVISDDN